MFCVKSNDKRVLEAAKMVMFLFEDSDFWRLVERQHFEDTNVTSRKLASLLKNWVKLEDITIYTYRPWWRWAPSIAKFKPSMPDKVGLNSRKLHRYDDHSENIASIGGSLMHEIVHLVDDKFIAFDFGHGDDSSKGKENTTPYRLGKLAKEFILKNY